MKKFIPWLLLLATQALGKEVDLKTTIREVTVFQTGAQVTRVGTVAIPAGESDIVIKDATSLLKKESIQVKGEGGFTILSVTHEANLNEQNADRNKWAGLEKKEKDLRRQMEDLSLKIEVLRTEEAVILNLQSVSPQSEGVTVEQVTKAQEMLQLKLTNIKNEKLLASRRMKELNESHQAVTQELNVLKIPKQSVTYEIVIHVKAKMETKGDFVVTYIVPNAHWYPTYDLRVKNISEPMQIDYKANVSQQTGEDWNNVKLKLSTGDPSRSSTKPELETWFLHLNEAYEQPKQQSNYYKYTDKRYTKVSGVVYDQDNGAVLPFCSVVVDGTNIGASTDINGKFNLVLPENASKLNISYVGYLKQTQPITSEEMKIFMVPDKVSLQEVEIVNYSKPLAYADDRHLNNRGARDGGKDYYIDGEKVVEGPTILKSLNIVSTEFAIEEKYTITSDPKDITVAIQSIIAKVKYQYYCAPRLDKDVFLMALMVDWEQYNFLEGQANVFFEGTYIGNTLLNTQFISDTLGISLGRDKSVKVERKKSKEYNKRQMLGGENITYRQWDLTVKNAKPQTIDIIIEDQYPLPVDGGIELKQGELKEARLNEKTGVITWQYAVEPGGMKNMQFKYSAKYPKGNFVGLD
jgi:hypothetical protein